MSVNPNSRIKVVTSISNMEINASDYIQFGTMIITIITTFIVPFIQRPMLSVDYPNYPESGSFNFNVTLANNGITALHNVKGSITIPHAAKPIEIIPDKYIPWSFAIKQDYDSHAARASFNINVLPPQVTVNLNVSAALADGVIANPLVSVFSDEWDGYPQLFTWGINAAVLIIGTILSYKLYCLLDKRLKRHNSPDIRS